MAMDFDLIHDVLNIVLIPSSVVALLFFVPPWYFYKFLRRIISIFKPPESEILAGKVVLITGASSGIGEALAYEYARRGARLALVARREDRLRAVLDKARRLGSSDAILICADVSKVQDCQRFVQEAFDHFGQLDHLVNNAGIVQSKMFQDFSPNFSNLAPVMDINFWGSVYATHFAVPHLRKSRGKIAVISSTAAWFPTPTLSFYNASKAALLSFFETLRTEFGKDIGITIVTPGIIKSEITKDQFILQAQMNTLPIESSERCAKAIVESTCRGDLYLTEPSWTRVGVWFKWFFPAVLEWCFHYKMVKGSTRDARKNS